MSILSMEDIKLLMGAQNGMCVSIYLPTEKAGRAVRQNGIRFKNLINQAEDALVARGLRKPDAAALLEPARELLNDNTFWQDQNDSLAVFISNDTFRYFRLPLNLDEFVLVNTSFHLKPLIPLLHGDGRFFILTLNQSKIGLYTVGRYEMNEIDPKTVSGSFAEYFDSFEVQTGMQWRTGSSSGLSGPAQPGSYHGQGVGEETVKALLSQYFRHLDNGIREFIGERQTPLMLAGVDYMVGYYRDANMYPYMVDEWIAGSPDDMPCKEMQRRAWEIMAPKFAKTQQEDIDRYHVSASSGLAADHIEAVVPAAYFGQVATLFVDRDKQVWGWFDAENNQVTAHQQQDNGDEDLLNLAAIHTLMNGGKVYAVPGDEVPSGMDVAATLRY